jgi:hypothetical protein
MANDDLRYLSEDQQRQLNNIIVMIQTSTAIPNDKKPLEVQNAVNKYVAELKAQGKLIIPNDKKSDAFAGLMAFETNNPTKKPTVKNPTTPVGHKHTGPIMLH